MANVELVIITGSLCLALSGLLLLIMSFIYLKRKGTRNWLLYKFPKHIQPISRKDVNKFMWGLIQYEMNRSDQKKLDPPIDDPMVVQYKFGWGNVYDIPEPIHFKSFISNSFRILEKASQKQIKKTQSVQDYVMMLREEMKDENLNWNLYLNHYEKARFSDEEFSEKEFKEFVKILFDIVFTCEKKFCTK